MYSIKPIDQVNIRDTYYEKFKKGMYKFGHYVEFIIVLGVWFYILNGKGEFNGFSINEIVTYLLAGNIIGIITGFLLYKIIRNDVIGNDSKLLLYKPFKYLAYLVLKGFGRILIPFLASIVFQVFLMYIFSQYIIPYPNGAYIIMICIVVVLAFITEYLLAYLLNMYKFWEIESPEMFQFIMRIKKIISGGYFPLTILPSICVKISLLFPFAYTFFVPMQLYLKKITIAEGIIGVCIQIFWVIILYVIVRYFWKKKFLESLKVNRS